ncbi:MlaD family protein [Tsukamurella paurometabola]|uniref:Mammalian cell entry related domain protein n=1 Tax=Tsukamurella paurometabola (strain ATCC 8368 / DSM 20162 / CCUG 35730 / CIP 100753 / JCM 10117 / KCTC 9821 / NBRC 16120 / NCIMB 702349 / NCTC 13040) TaxID=521096 RepID=D5UYR8_TSUPD|nr:MlaD family protein [Tsukamurella paurometabola]ADG80371.1 Mammalian cell entry related domain protein [Tsukamurella paurometabola DSM 20162]SUP39389.1 Phage-related protein [Tsukamurella paurometabola]
MIFTGRPPFRGLMTRSVKLGAIAVAVALLITAGLAYVYLRPPGQKELTFTTQDAALIKSGVEVRASGVRIGTIKSVELDRDSVKVTARIDDGVFVGDQTSVAVRMLTVAGGFYVAVTSAGKAALGDKPIPSSRVNLPYSIGDLLQDVPEKLVPIDRTQLASSIKALSTGLDANPGSVDNIVEGVNALIGQLTEQRDQVGRIINVSTQYATAFADQRETIMAMIRKASLAIVTLDQTAVNFGKAYEGLAGMFGKIKPFLDLYWKYREQLGNAFTTVESALKTTNVTIPAMIGELQKSIDAMQQGLAKQGTPMAPDTVLASKLCFPSATVSC